MKEIPILFSTPMVRALLEDRKSQTRRICKPQPVYDEDSGYVYIDNVIFDIHDKWAIPMYLKDIARWEEGDILWVRETWFRNDINSALFFGSAYTYKADVKDEKLFKWKPSIFMPKEACRIRLEVEDIRVQRLQEISEEDAIAEGIGIMPEGYGLTPYRNYLGEGGFVGARTSYQTLWESINGKDSWDKNPWVWAITFKRIEP